MCCALPETKEEGKMHGRVKGGKPGRREEELRDVPAQSGDP